MSAVASAVATPSADTDRMIGFIESIGIPVRFGPVPEDSFLPGILIDRGALVVDRERLLYPGDLLHEAGHIAVMHPVERARRSGDVSKNLGDEIGTICWSWAAAVQLGIDAGTLFHDNGYKGKAAWFRDCYSRGEYPGGVPLLEYYQLTLSEASAAAQGLPPYPHMLKWLREEP